MVEIGAGPHTYLARVSGPEDGRLVLLLHGFPQTSYQWRHQLAALRSAGHRAVAFDQRGYSPGARPEGVEQYRTDHLVGDVLRVADALGADRFDLVGHDFGGAVAWLVAARHAGRLRTLTSVAMPHPAAFAAALVEGDPDQTARSAYIDQLREPGAEAALLAGGGGGLRVVFAASGHPDPAGGTDEYVRVLSQPGALTGALNWYRAMSVADAAALLGGRALVDVPTLFVWGDADVALGRVSAEATAGQVRGPYRFVPLGGVGHWIAEEVPEVLNHLLLEHLAAHG